MDRIDRILLAEQELTPSASFAGRVMDAVRAQAETPPLAFPWKSFVLGFALLPMLAALCLWWLVQLVPLPLQLGLQEVAAGPAAVDPRWLWVAAVLAGSALLVFWSYRLAAES